MKHWPMAMFKGVATFRMLQNNPDASRSLINFMKPV